MDNGGPAFASAGLDWHQDGMSLRDYFAASAITGIVRVTDDQMTPKEMAEDAYKIADALLAERAKATQ